jgi:hypothetical protein
VCASIANCPSCAQVMRLARMTSRFGDLPDLYTFECRACGVSHIEPGFSASIAGALQLGACRKDLWDAGDKRDVRRLMAQMVVNEAGSFTCCCRYPNPRSNG